MSNTIKLKKYSDVIEEYRAAGTITPGMLLAYGSNGKVAAHAVKGGSAVPIFALEDELQGKGIGDDYSTNDPVQCWLPYRGDQVYALIKGAAVVKGDLLQSAGDGSLEKYTPALKAAEATIKSGANGLKVTALKPGVAGNAIVIKLIGSESATAGSEVVAVDDSTAPGVIIISVTFKSDATASTLTQVVAAINGKATANVLVKAEVVGSGAADAFEAEQALTGGEEVNFGQAVAQAIEAVNPASATVRIAARIV